MRFLASILLLAGSLGASDGVAWAAGTKAKSVRAPTTVRAKRVVRTSKKRTPNARLAILPFDHRGSFEKDFLGIQGRAPTKAERAKVRKLKRIVFDGLVAAIKSGSVPIDEAAVLVDEQYGRGILEDAQRLGLRTAVSVEKSGQAIFDFQNGDRFAAALDRVKPTFAKVLVRYNPEDPPEARRQQLSRLKQLSDHLKTTPYQFMFELLVPPTSKLEGEELARYDTKRRPALTRRAIAEIQASGIEPDVWKLEGVDSGRAFRSIAAQARRGGRDDVRVIVLGRGESGERVKRWLDVGASTPGVNGFAVGRTVFQEPLKAYLRGEASAKQASEAIAAKYVDLYRGFKASSSGSPAAGAFGAP